MDQLSAHLDRGWDLAQRAAAPHRRCAARRPKADTEEATKCMPRLPDPPFEAPSYMFLIGRAYYELAEGEKALPFIEEAVRADASHADAYYYLGLLRDDG